MIGDWRLAIGDFFKGHWFPLVITMLVVAAGYCEFSVWNHARDIRLATETGALQSEISNLKSQAGLEERRAIEAEGRAQKLGEELEKRSAISRQLSADLEKAKAEAVAEQARIAALPAPAVAQEVSQALNSEFRIQNLEFSVVNERAARGLLGLVGERNACREQSTIKDQQFQICRESMVDYAAIGEQQAIQIRELKQALDLERQAFASRDELADKQVKTAKGSWWGRFTGKAKWFAIGVGAGAVAGAVAAR